MNGLSVVRGAAGAVIMVAVGLAGCVPVALVGGAVGASALMMTAERRSAETQEADRTIQADAQERVVKLLGERGHVNLTTYYRKVLITGEVPSAEDSQQVAAEVGAVPGVVGVINELAVMPSSTVLQRSNDALITSKVRARLVNQNGVPAASIKVLTERGTTYLMGRLTAMETTLATEVARQTDGVQRVVRVIDLIAEPSGAAASTNVAPAADPAVTGAAPAAGDQAPGVVVSPVTQPVVEQPRPAVQVQTLPPVK